MALTHEREWIEARDAGYEAGLKAAHEDPNILASYSWSQGYAAALSEAFEAVSDALASADHFPRSFRAARIAINKLREGKK